MSIVQKPGSAPARPELSLLAASLIQAGLVGLEELLGHLTPSDEDMRKVQLWMWLVLCGCGLWVRCFEALGCLGARGVLAAPQPRHLSPAHLSQPSERGPGGLGAAAVTCSTPMCVQTPAK